MCHWREFTSQVGRETHSGWVCGWEDCDLSMERNSMLCCSGTGWDWDSGRKRRHHRMPSRNRRRSIASESRFRNTVKLGLWELEVELEQTALKYCILEPNSLLKTSSSDNYNPSCMHRTELVRSCSNKPTWKL